MAIPGGIKFINPDPDPNIPHVLGFSNPRQGSDTLFEVWNGATSGAAVFKVDKDGDVQATDLTLAGALNVSGDVAVNTNRFTVAAATGNTTIAGTLGVTGLATLASLSVTGGATVGGTLGVTGAVSLSNNLAVSGNATVGGTLGVTGAVTFSTPLGVTSGGTGLAALGNPGQLLAVNASATGLEFVDPEEVTISYATLPTGSGTWDTGAGTTLTIGRKLAVAETLTVGGATSLHSSLAVTSNFAVATDKFTIDAATGNTAIAGTLGVTGATTLSGTLGVTGAATMGSSLAVTGDLAVNTSKFTVTASSGNTAVGGTLSVTGAATFASTLGVTGNVAVNTNKFTIAAATGNTAIAGTLTVAGTLTASSNLIVSTGAVAPVGTDKWVPASS